VARSRLAPLLQESDALVLCRKKTVKPHADPLACEGFITNARTVIDIEPKHSISACNTLFASHRKH